MRKLANTYVMRVLIVAFAVVQLLFLTPHHHHGGSDAACIDIRHCIVAEAEAHDDCDGNHDECGSHAPAVCNDGHGLCTDHSHQGSDDECRYTTIDFFVPERGANHDFATFAIDLHGHFCGTCGGSVCLPEEHGDDIRAKEGVRHPREAEPLHISYIAAAIPPRAPSFTV